MGSETIYVTGIDVSSAFDTIRRTTLLEVPESLLDEDETKIIKYLLVDTTMEIKMSNVRGPQGDALSGTLFTIYFEYVLRKIRNQLNQPPPPPPV